MKERLLLVKRGFLVTIVVGLLAISGVFAQKVRLRSQITPTCNSGTSNWKFADIFADGNIAVQGSYGCRGAFIYDLSDPDSPVLASWYNPGNNQQFLEAIVVGNRGYFGSGNGGGVHIVDLSDPYHPLLLGTVDSSHGGGHNSIHEMMIYDQAGARYLIENYNNTGTRPVRVLNITDPTAPVFKWEYTPSDGGWVHAMHIRGNRMFTSEYTSSGIEVFDISNLATQAPTFIKRILSNTTNHSTWTSEDGNYVYSCRETQDGDLRVYDIHDIQNPLLVRVIKAGDLGINAHTPHNPVVMGNKLYVSWYQAGVQVFDITNPSDPRRIGQYDTFQPMYLRSNEKSLLESEPWDMICGASNLQNALPTDYDGDWAVYPFLGEDKVLAGDLTSGLLVLDVTKINSTAKNIVSDYDGDGRTDLSVFTPATGNWTIEKSSDSSAAFANWGIGTDIVTPGDYNGDGKTDYAVFRPSDGNWYIKYDDGNVRWVHWGTAGDVPVEADYDADGKTDIAVWRPSDGNWYIYNSSIGVQVIRWGTAGDKVFPGDFDGDGRPDFAVFRPSDGNWYILYSSTSLASVVKWGTAGDIPLMGDFDGDGKADIAVFRPSDGNWYIVGSLMGVAVYNWGVSEDLPVPADYDGDGKADIAIFRPSQNIWYSINSNGNVVAVRNYGQSGDTPLPESVHP